MRDVMGRMDRGRLAYEDFSLMSMNAMLDLEKG